MFELASPTGKSFRFVRAWRDATRDHYTLGRFVPRTVPAAAPPPPPRLWSRVLAFGLAFGFWLLASFFCFFFFCSFSSARLCAWVLAFLLLRACALGFWLLASLLLLLLLLRACVLGFWLLSWLLGFGFCMFGVQLASSIAKYVVTSLVKFLAKSIAKYFR